MSAYQIRDEGDPRKYFIQIPNMVDDLDLSIEAVRLYLHLKRVTGDLGKCTQTTRTLAEHCKMSTGSVSNAKKELVAAKLIAIKHTKSSRGLPSHEITILDIWGENIEKYKSSQHELISSRDELIASQDELISSPDEIKEEPIKKNNTSVESSDKYSPAQSLFLSTFGAKRFATVIQMQTVREIEDKYGYQRVEDLVKWAAKQGMALGRAVVSVESALKKKPKSNGEQKPITVNEDGSLYV